MRKQRGYQDIQRMNARMMVASAPIYSPVVGLGVVGR